MDQLSDDELVAVRESLDKQAIYENAVKYCRGADRLDIDLLKDAYWEDGTDDHGGFVGNTHDFCEFAVASKGLFTSVNHHVSNIQIELLGDRAKVESYFIAAHLIPAADSDKARLLASRRTIQGSLRKACRAMEDPSPSLSLGLESIPGKPI